MAREGGEEDSLLQLPKSRTCHYRLPGYKEQTLYLQEALQKKALKDTWDSESESEEEVNTANVCFLANENTTKVTSESSLKECELSMDKLDEAFEELSNNYDFLKKKYLKIKKKNEFFKIH